MREQNAAAGHRIHGRRFQVTVSGGTQRGGLLLIRHDDKYVGMLRSCRRQEQKCRKRVHHLTLGARETKRPKRLDRRRAGRLEPDVQIGDEPDDRHRRARNRQQH